MQTKSESFKESLFQVTTGYVVAVLAQLVIFPAFGVVTSFTKNLGIAACFMVVSLIRQYIIRRWFNVEFSTVQDK